MYEKICLSINMNDSDYIEFWNINEVKEWLNKN